MEPAGADWRLSDLLGAAGDRAARSIEARARARFRASWGRNPEKRDLEDDFVQEVLRGALETAHRIAAGATDEPSNLDAWLNRVTCNAVHKQYRDDRWKATLRDHPEMAEIAELVTVDRELVWSIRKVLRRVQGRMDPECIELLRRRLIDEEPREVLAAERGVNSNTLGVRIHRCLTRLRELVRGVGGSGMTFLEAR